VASDLNIQIAVPFEVQLPSGERVLAQVLVRWFGARNGMLIVNDSSAVWRLHDELEGQGYGFSVMDPPGLNEEYDVRDATDILEDWGWSGHDSKRPDWLLSVGPDP
jgi:hypothetical protein